MVIYALVIDDSRTVRMVATDVLGCAGIEVVAVADPDAAYAAIAERAPDVIVLDLELGDGKRGEDMVDRLAAVAPVIVLSSHVARGLAVLSRYKALEKTPGMEELPAVVAAAARSRP